MNGKAVIMLKKLLQGQVLSITHAESVTSATAW
jgi:hypothetical protein